MIAEWLAANAPEAAGVGAGGFLGALLGALASSQDPLQPLAAEAAAKLLLANRVAGEMER